MLIGKPEIKKIQDFIFITDMLVDRAKTDIEKWYNEGEVILRQPNDTDDKPSLIHCRPLTSRIFTKCLGYVPAFLKCDMNNIDWEAANASLDLMIQIARHCITSIDGVPALEYEFSGEKILTMNSIDALADIFKEMVQIKGQNMQINLPMWIGGLLLNNFFRSIKNKD